MACDPQGLGRTVCFAYVQITSYLLTVSQPSRHVTLLHSQIGLNIGKVLSERSYSVVVQAREIFNLRQALTSGASSSSSTNSNGNSSGVTTLTTVNRCGSYGHILCL